MNAFPRLLPALAMAVLASACAPLNLQQDFSPVPAPAPAAGDRWTLQVLNGYNKLPVGSEAYEVVSAGGERTEVRLTRDAGRPEVRAYDAGWNPLSGRMAPGLPTGYNNVLTTGAPVSYSPALPALRFPLEPGASWKSRITVAEVGSGRSVEADVSGKVLGLGQVETPAGRFDAIRVRQDIYYRDFVWWRTPIHEWHFEWYAPSLGIVVHRQTQSSYIDLTRGGGTTTGGNSELMYGDFLVEQLLEYTPAKPRPQR